MSEKEFNQIFANNLKYYLEKNHMTQVEFAYKMKVGTTSVYNWCNGVKIPRMDKIDKMCEIFGCKRSDLISDTSDTPHYYLDDDAREYAEFLFKNPEYKVLFDASCKVKAEDIDFVRQMIDRINGEENG